MNQITLRGIPAEVEELVRGEAKARGVSLNKAFISLLSRVSALPNKAKPGRRHKELDRFCGLWSAEEADAFDQLAGEQRGIDGDLWK
jgi:hypothetical protein